MQPEQNGAGTRQFFEVVPLRDLGGQRTHQVSNSTGVTFN